MALSAQKVQQFEHALARSLGDAQRNPKAHQRRLSLWLWVGAMARPWFAPLANQPAPQPAMPRGQQAPLTSNIAAELVADRPRQKPSDDMSTVDQAPHARAGQRLQRSDHQALFQLIDDLSALANMSPFAQIHLNDDVNASISFAPPAPNAAGPQNKAAPQVLTLGRGLLGQVSVDELRAVLAHELGHYAGRQGQLAVRCQSLHQDWLAIADAPFDRPGVGVSARLDHNTGRGVRHKALKLVRGAAQLLARCYARQFFVQAFPVYRAAEFEADQFAARLVGAKLLGSALMRTAIAQVQLVQAAPCEPCVPFGGQITQPDSSQTDSAASRREGAPDAGIERAQILRDCLFETAPVGDSHPSLRARLKALDLSPDCPPSLPAFQTAAILLSQ